jgi:hypothetical protein
MNTRKSAHRILASVALAATMAFLPATTSVAQAQAVKGAGIAVPVTGTATAVDGTIQTVSGTLTIQRFSRAQHQIFAEGTLVATITGAAPGAAVQNVVTQVSMPLVMPGGPTTLAATPAIAVASCDILNLNLGALDLNLLGLTVHLNQVVLNIVAVTGAGNLLGNLLCAITGLLDAGGPLSSIVALLNSLLGVLG